MSRAGKPVGNTGHTDSLIPMVHVKACAMVGSGMVHVKACTMVGSGSSHCSSLCSSRHTAKGGNMIACAESQSSVSGTGWLMGHGP